MKTGAPFARPMVGLILLVVAIVGASCSPIARPTPTRTPDPTATATATSTPASPVSKLPVEGQLIIPKGYRFTIPNGMVGTTWHFPPFDEVESIVKFSAGVASDRAGKYGGRPADYVTVVWTGDLLTEGDGAACPDKFYSQPGVGAPGAVIGSKNCIQMLEYRLSQ